MCVNNSFRPPAVSLFPVADCGDGLEGVESVLSDISKLVYPQFFKHLDRSQYWKLLFMERVKISEGKRAYESEEPGYLPGMYRGYLFMLNSLDQPLTPELYCRYHDETVEEVFSVELRGKIPLGFRNSGTEAEAFQVILEETLSKDGLSELLKRYNEYKYVDSETGDEYFFLKDAMTDPKTTIDLSSANRSFIQLRPTRSQTAAVNVAACIEYFNAMPKTTEEEILLAIARICQDLDQLHVFVDGNIRTSGILLLNRLLILNNLSPCVLEDVNCLDCLSQKEIVERIREGQCFFQQLL